MSRFIQIIVGAVLTLTLLLWSAVWWVTRDQQKKGRRIAECHGPKPADALVTKVGIGVTISFAIRCSSESFSDHRLYGRGIDRRNL